MKLILAEKPFHTLQGEGLLVGHPAVFIRTSGCNLRCEWATESGDITRCDTPYASFSPERIVMTIDEVLECLPEANYSIVLTGGEPTMQWSALCELIERAKAPTVTVETNGTNAVCMPGVDLFSISPKITTIQNQSEDAFISTVESVLRLISLNIR